MALIWLVTGVSSGLGYSIALKVLEEGHHVIGTVRSRQRAAEAVTVIEAKGGKVLELDVTDAKACLEVWTRAEKVHGHVDVLCNNAGMCYVGALEDFRYGLTHKNELEVTRIQPLYAMTYNFSDDEVQAQMDVNFHGPYRLIRAALPGFRERRSGTIVNISSVSGIDGSIASGLYAASKFALEGLSEGLAKGLAEHNVNVVLVEPGVFRTNFLGAFKENNEAHLDQYSTAQKTIEIFNAFHRKQRGDPAKAAARIVEIVSGQGMAGSLKGKVLRLPLGPDCVQRYKAKVESMSADLEMVAEVARSTDLDV